MFIVSNFFTLVELDAGWVIVSGLILYFPGHQKKRYGYAELISGLLLTTSMTSSPSILETVLILISGN
jgi:hypothetical protein